MADREMVIMRIIGGGWVRVQGMWQIGYVICEGIVVD